MVVTTSIRKNKALTPKITGGTVPRMNREKDIRTLRPPFHPCILSRDGLAGKFIIGNPLVIYPNKEERDNRREENNEWTGYYGEDCNGRTSFCLSEAHTFVSVR